jgi:rhodanese-related sulfurtransferase
MNRTVAQASVLVLLALGLGAWDSARRPVVLALAPAPVPPGPVTPGPVTPGPVTPGTTAAAPDSVTPPASSAQGPFVTIDRAQELIAAGAVWLDARLPHQFAEGPIEGAELLPPDAFTSAGDASRLEFLNYYPKDQAFVIYCDGGDCHASESVAVLLKQAGFSNLFIMKDGYIGWTARNLPTVKPAPAGVSP